MIQPWNCKILEWHSLESAKPWHDTTIEAHNHEMTQPWTCKILEWQTMVLHNLGMTQPWNCTILEWHNHGIAQSWNNTTKDVHKQGITQPWNCITMEQLTYGNSKDMEEYNQPSEVSNFQYYPFLVIISDKFKLSSLNRLLFYRRTLTWLTGNNFTLWSP